MTRINKIHIVVLLTVMLLSIVNHTPCVYAATNEEYFFSEDFENMTDWVSLSNDGWTSPNGAPVSIVKEGNNKYVNIVTPWGSGLSKIFNQPVTGFYNLEMDLAISYPSISNFGLINSVGETINILEFKRHENWNKVIFAPTGDDLSIELQDDEWIRVKLLLDTNANKCSMWITRQGQQQKNIFSDYNINGFNEGLGGINFTYPLHWPNYDGNNFKLDNIKIYKRTLQTGLDENFDTYSSVSDMTSDWKFKNNDNIMIMNGELCMLNDSSVENIHNPYNTESLIFSGKIKYPASPLVEDKLSVSVLSDGDYLEIFNCTGDKQLNGKLLEMLEEDSYFDFEAIINSVDFDLKINKEIVYSGVIAIELSKGITGVRIKTDSSSIWCIDDLKTQPSLSSEQMQELQEDLDTIDIQINEGDTEVSLPSIGMNGSNISWVSNDKSMVDPKTGTVANPTWEVGPKNVVLTCYVTKYSMTLSKSFTFSMVPVISNIFKNGDFEQLDENGRPKAWFSTSTVPLTSSAQAQSGNKSALVTGRADSTHSGAQNITLKPDRYYRLSGYVKLHDEVVEGQDGRISVWMHGGSINSPVGDNTNYVTAFDAFYMNTSDWTKLYSDFNTCVTPQTWPAMVHMFPFPVGSSTLSFYMDNFELYEYVLHDLSINGQESIVVPNNGDSIVKFSPEAKNQYGTTVGMEQLSYEWSISEAATGITINKQGELSVSEYVENQTITLNCKVKEGTVAGSTWIHTSKNIAIVNNASDKPKAYQLSIVGDFKNGNSITASYRYFQKDNLQEENSQIKWYMADEFDGSYIEILGQTSPTLLIDASLEEKFIKFSVTPETKSGIKGEMVSSTVITKPRVPIAYDVQITGNAIVGEKLAGSHHFLDYNGDEEGDTQFQWLISDTKDGIYTHVSDADNIELIVTEDMKDKFIKFQVIPVSKIAPEIGMAYTSVSLYGPTMPIISDVKISGKARVNEVLAVTYIYSDINNDAEKNSIVKWYSDGKLLQTSATYIPSESETGQKIYAEVTPVSQFYPFQGMVVKSQTVAIAKKESMSSSSGGGGVEVSGGVNNSVDHPIIENPAEGPKTAQFDDIDGHWAENDIKALAELGLLKGKTKNEFYPEDTITRAEILTVVVRIINKTNEVYQETFSDVASNDWYCDTVQTALKYNIISPSSYFNPNDAITREEISKIIAQAYKLMMNNQWPLSYDLSSFSDQNQISEWAVGYIGGCLELGLLMGNDDGALSAKAHATRAQAAAIMNRLVHLIY